MATGRLVSKSDVAKSTLGALGGYAARNAKDAMLPTGLALGAGTAAERRRHQQGGHPVRTAATVGTAAAAEGAYRTFGLGYVQRKGKRLEGPRPGQTRSQYQKLVSQHKRAHGVGGLQGPALREALGRTPGYFRSYPRELGGWRYKRALGQMSSTRGKVLETAAVTLPTLAVARLGRHDRVRKGGRRFAAVGTLTGTGGLGSALALHEKDRDESSRQAAAVTTGGWAGQGAYQGGGYAAKWRADAKTPATQRTGARRSMFARAEDKKAVDRAIRERRVHAERFPGTADYHRHTPLHWSGARTRRVLGWTHNGRTGTAVGTAATLGGSVLAARAVRDRPVHKADYGYAETRVSPIRATGAAAGITLLGWGGSRLGLVKGTLKAGAKREGRVGINFRRAEKARAAVEGLTGRGAKILGSQLNTGFRLRPIEGAVGGALLLDRSIPVRRRKFTSIQQGGY